MSAPEGRPGGAATAERPAARPAATPALPAALAPPEVPEPRLTPPPDAEILDPEALRAAIAAAAAAAAEPEARRRAVAQAAAEARQAGFARISAHLEADPWSAIWARGAYARLADAVIGALFEAARGPLAPEGAGAGTPFALLAVGGYGRAEMAPYSDIDLLVLSEAPLDAAAKATVETLLYLLWDMKLKVGHAARTIDEAIRFGREDHTIRTAMLEHRLIAGDETIARRFGQRFRRELVRGSRAEFIEAKLAERAERHRRQGAYRFMVEPNLKEGKGGLRDLQSLMWLTRFVYGIGTTAEMEERGLLRPDERALFDAAERFLWAVRCQLHLAAGRAVEQLTFDMQVEVARRLGYRDHGGRRAVEHFMQDYFRVATRVGDLTRILLTQLEARHVKRPPGVGGMLAEAGRRLRVRLRPGFRRREGRLDIRDPESFFADPVNILRLFDEGLRTGLLIHPEAMRQVQAHLHLIDDRMRRDPEAARIFFRLLLERGNPERSLRRMNELGVLGAYIPEFQPVVAMMQFNMYHRYTVDEHTIQCISVLAGIERGELTEDHPLSASILRRGVNRRVLYLALLMHDAGKGRDEDHSVVGARLARQVARRLGLDPDEVALVEWLVRHHLLMSDVAQKRDITDPRTVRDFARQVETVERLDLLTVLTVCDIRGVGPGVWNNWKAQVLRDLYNLTRPLIEDGRNDYARHAREQEARDALAAALAAEGWPEEKIRAELARHKGPYWQGLPSSVHAIFARLLDGIREDEIRMDITADPARDATRACFALADHPGIFSRLAGALALVGANVVEARSYTSSDGWATAVFWIQDAEGHPYEEHRLGRLRRMIERTLKGEVVAREALRERERVTRREREFRVPTTITIDNEASDIYTVIEVDTRDRPGLLYDLTRTITAANLQIASAVIATYGVQAVDTFYVKDIFGLKLYSKSRQEALRRRLLEAIERGRPGAGAAGSGGAAGGSAGGRG